jgi:hypothetical protein
MVSSLEQRRGILLTVPWTPLPDAWAHYKTSISDPENSALTSDREACPRAFSPRRLSVLPAGAVAARTDRHPAPALVAEELPVSRIPDNALHEPPAAPPAVPQGTPPIARLWVALKLSPSLIFSPMR